MNGETILSEAGKVKMEAEKEEIVIPWLEKMKEKREEPSDPEYVTLLEEIEHR